MRRLAGLLIAVLLLVAGCAGYTVQSPVKSTNLAAPQLDTTQMVTSMRGFIDALCPVPTVQDPRGDFGAGLMDGYFLNRQQMLFSAQQLADLQAFKDFCKKPKEQRTDYEYGFLSGRFADGAVRQLMPFFGRDALSIGAYLGLLP